MTRSRAAPHHQNTDVHDSPCVTSFNGDKTQKGKEGPNQKASDQVTIATEQYSGVFPQLERSNEDVKGTFFSVL